MLFATGHFLHDYVVREFLDNSPLREFVYAEWSCADWTYGSTEHNRLLDTYDNVITRQCICGKPFTEHHEIELLIDGLVGHPDLIFLMNNKYYIREFKTYDRSDIPFDDLTAVLPGHRLQVSSYWKMLWAKARKEGRTVSSDIVVEYIDRSNSKLFGGHPFKPLACKPYDAVYMERIKNSVDHFNHGVSTGLLPERICNDIKDRRARECDRAVECFLRRYKHVANVPPKSASVDQERQAEVPNRRRRLLKKRGDSGIRQLRKPSK